MFKTIKVFVTLFLMICLNIGYAQNANSSVVKNLPSPFQLTSKAKNPYAQINMLKELESLYLNSEQSNSFLEAMSTAYTFIAQYQKALETFDKLSWTKTYKDIPDTSCIEGLTAVNALDIIDSLAAETRAVFINEAHHYPAHRTFVIKLLAKLKEKGFKYFAVETVNRLDTLLNKRKYPLFRETGYYTKEPVYGELIREAIKHGYLIVPFDYEGEYKLEDREKGQAQNIIDRILKRDQNAKILLLTGYTHIRESSSGTEEKMMAQYFKELSGIDPLTIEQTLMSEHSAPEYELPEYRYADAKGLLTDYVSFIRADKTLYAKDFGDLTVFHPRTKFISKRPHWINFNNTKYPYQLPDEVMQFQKPFLVKVFNSAEGIKSVPVDVVEVTEAGVPVLLLAAGQYTFRFIRHWDSEAFLEFNINIE